MGASSKLTHHENPNRAKTMYEHSPASGLLLLKDPESSADKWSDHGDDALDTPREKFVAPLR